MGLEFNALNLMRFAKKQGGSFRRTATLGRQWGTENAYCEGQIKRDFGAEVVDSFDNSAYEGATQIVDLGAPFTHQFEPYDTVFDGGTLEHIYNIPQALWNTSQLCKPGGQILHVLPANNLCGHGFYQFSPELFFSLYSERNGYHDTVVFMSDFRYVEFWWKAARPANGHRITRNISGELTAAVVRTVRGETVSHKDVYQSDYVHAWNGRGGITEEPEPDDFVKCRVEELI